MEFCFRRNAAGKILPLGEIDSIVLKHFVVDVPGGDVILYLGPYNLLVLANTAYYLMSCLLGVQYNLKRPNPIISCRDMGV